MNIEEMESSNGIRLSERLLIYLSLSIAALILGYVFGEMGYPPEPTKALVVVVSVYSTVFLIGGTFSVTMRLYDEIFNYANISKTKISDLIDIALLTLYSVVYFASFPILLDALYIKGTELHIDAGTLALDVFSITEIIMKISLIGLIVSIIIHLIIDMLKNK